MARSSLSGSVEKLSSFPIIVRVNNAKSPHFEKDVEEAVMCRIAAIQIPKVDGEKEVRSISALISTIEKRSGIPKNSVSLVPLIESAASVLSIERIARSSPRVVGLAFGSGDYALDFGLSWTKEGLEYKAPRMILPIVARAIGLFAIDGVFMDLDDLTAFMEDSVLSRRIGYQGRMVVHPTQIKPANQAYLPSKEEVLWANKVVRVYKKAISQDIGAVKVDGLLIDELHYKLAQRILSPT
ncbi:MAG: HpcH/HpaI aldolase/citrate lyase family protein [Nitrososphaerales archaeon]